MHPVLADEPVDVATPLSGLHSSSSRITSTFDAVDAALGVDGFELALCDVPVRPIRIRPSSASVMPTRMVLSCAKTDGRRSTIPAAPPLPRREPRCQAWCSSVTPPCVASTKHRDGPSSGSPERVRDQSLLLCDVAGRRLRPRRVLSMVAVRRPPSARDDRVVMQFCPCKRSEFRPLRFAIIGPELGAVPAAPGCSKLCATEGGVALRSGFKP